METDWGEFRKWSVRAAEWGAEHRRSAGDRPVRPKAEFGDVRKRLPAAPPESPEGMEAIFQDFESLIVPGMTQWQHPRFFAYFPANAAPPSVIAEILASAMGAQCMLWQTSPAATELEIVMIDWLRQATGLPEGMTGVLQDSASSSTLAAVLTMRERALEWRGNRSGLAGQKALRVYASHEGHSSLERAVWVAGIGGENLVRIPITGPDRSMDPGQLDAAIRSDLESGHLPAGVISSAGATGAGAFDRLPEIHAIARRHGLYAHVDAAWAGAAMICPEYRRMWKGVEEADSVVLNPHKWLGAQLECSAHFVKDPEPLLKTLSIRPEYLKTPGRDDVVNFSEWSVQLGRRFRALKLWFVIRAYGLEGLREMIRAHVAWSAALAERLRQAPGFEIVTEPSLSLFTFRCAPGGVDSLDEFNLELVSAINDDGRIYLTQAVVDGRTVIRFQAGHCDMTERDAGIAYEAITETAERLRRRA